MTDVLTVLVVDDDSDIRDVVVDLLEGEGYSVVTASDGIAALEAASQRDLAAILLDMKMPRMDGWEFARCYSATPEPHAPIVVMTAAQDASQRARDIGAAAYVAKPFRLDEMLTAVEAVTHRSDNHSRAR
jgi:CheY-like chemotaxis protein